MFIFARLYLLLRARSRAVVVTALALIACCTLFSATLVVREDITTLMPQKPAGLAAQFTLLRDAPVVQGLAIAVGGPDPAGTAAHLAEKLRGPEMPHIVSGANTAVSPAFITNFCAAVPGLMDEAAIAGLSATVEGAAIHAALQRDLRLMRSPQGIALRDLVAMDPLGICAAFMKTLMPQKNEGTFRFDRGSLRSRDGRYALLLAEPAAPMADSDAARAVMATVRAALHDLPPETPTFVAGGHRHTEENTNIIRADMQRILPLSLLLLALAYLVFVRTWAGISIVLLPGAALTVGAACTGLVYGSVSGIVIGFGSVILGIAADYAIHVYYGLRSGRPVPEVLMRVAPPMLFGAGTTLAAFTAFFSSTIPCIIQMTVFAVTGIAAAVLLALVVLPHAFPQKNAPQAREEAPPPPATIQTRGLGFLWVLLSALLAFLLWNAPVNGDIRALSYASDALRRDEAALREHFGGIRDVGLFAVHGADEQEALRQNDRLWAALRADATRNNRDSTQILSLAALMPAEETQKTRHAAWRAFWEANAPSALSHLTASAAATGFSDEAFAPFRHWLTAEPPLITPESLRAGGLDIAAALVRKTEAGASVYSLVRGGELPPETLAVLREYKASFTSGAVFRKAMDNATRADLLRFGGISLLAVICMSAAFFRSPTRMGMALLPVGAALCVTLGVFRLTGMSLNIFHAMALPLVMCLSVDYGIFILAGLEGNLGGEARIGVLLSGITTLSGFGVLLLARHPALHSLGLSVSVGLLAALFTAFIVLPRLTRRAHTTPLSRTEGA